MNDFEPSELKNLYTPPPDSHKGQNGKLLLIGGSELFHAASLWSLKVASRIVDMVFYASVPVNNRIVLEAKKEFRDGIVIPREHIEDYVQEADCILIGPGMVRAENPSISVGRHESRFMNQELRLQEINEIKDEGEQTYQLTKYLLQKYPEKRWVVDGGALQMMDPEWLKAMPQVILTPHQREFERVFELSPTPENLEKIAKEYQCVILCKGKEDMVCSPTECVVIRGGNSGMTKGGTGDVLAGLVGALACKNDLFLAACAGSYVNKKAGERLYERVGINFNASDLADEIPHILATLF